MKFLWQLIIISLKVVAFYISWFLVILFAVSAVDKCSAEEIRIGIIDTGYREDLSTGKLKLCKTDHYDFLTKKHQIGYTNMHGVRIGNIIGEALIGVDYCAVIYQVYNHQTDPRYNYVRALRLAADDGLLAINLSYSGEDAIPEEQAILTKISQHGTMLFIAAGNDKKDVSQDCSAYPTCYDLPNAVVVGALDNDGEPALYSNFGPIVDTWEVGESWAGDYWQGTSFSAPRALSRFVRSFWHLMHPELAKSAMRLEPPREHGTTKSTLMIKQRGSRSGTYPQSY